MAFITSSDARDESPKLRRSDDVRDDPASPNTMKIKTKNNTVIIILLNLDVSAESRNKGSLCCLLLVAYK